MDFKKLISKIEEVDGKVEAVSAPVLPKSVQLNEDAELRVLAGTSSYIAEAKKKAEEKTEEGLDMNLLKSAQGAMSKNKKDAESDKNVGKKYGYRGPDGSESDEGDNKAKKKAKKESIDTEAFKGKFAKMVESKKKKPDADGDGVPDWADKKPGKDDNADKGEKKETKGLSAKQKKLPAGLQKAIAKKKGTSESVKTAKKVVAESVETKLSLKDMLRIVKESGGQQQIDPVDNTLWTWANRVATSKITEGGEKAEIFAAMIYERNGGRFEMYDVLAEDQK